MTLFRVLVVVCRSMKVVVLETIKVLVPGLSSRLF